MGTSNYSDEFKRDAVHQITVRGYPVREVSQRLGVSTYSLYKWLKLVGSQVSGLVGRQSLTTFCPDSASFNHCYGLGRGSRGGTELTQVLASLRVNSKNPSAFVEYLNSAMPLILAAGGQVAKRIDLGEQLIGDGGSSLILLVDYPNREAVDAVFSSPEYQKLIPVRDRAFLSYHVSIVETAEVPEFA